MSDPRQKIIDFIENENSFQILAEFKRLNILSREDVSAAMTMDREGFLKFMKEKAGVLEQEDD